ncbi:MAG: sensor histidine kinase [Sphingomonadaceae bacterium]|nr:sensor histidine kinase [Sphingomonadaceae bacterium]
MHFDDRLTTVLKQPVSGKAIARIQYVQLIDLLGTLPNDAQGPLVDSAYDRLLELTPTIDMKSRARLLRDSGLRLRNPKVLALLAENEPPVASAAIAVAELEEDQWLELIPALPVRSRGILRHRRNLGEKIEARLERLGIADRGLPPGNDNADAVAIPGQARAPVSHETTGSPNGIGAIVRRIEAYRKEHPANPGQSGIDAPRLPLGDVEAGFAHDQPCNFDFTTNAKGRIIGANPEVAPMLIGLALASQGSKSRRGAAMDLAGAIGLRQPIHGQILTISGAPAISGDWQIDAAPLFNELTSAFTGYTGRARRMPATPDEVSPARQEADRMRQVLHELRNPAGAIQVSAECIQQQVFGDIANEYRAIAASIASDTALVLAGFEELERLVKLNAGAIEIEPGVADLAATVTATAAQIHHHTQQRESGFALALGTAKQLVAMDHAALERLIWRLLAGIAGEAQAKEMLGLCLDSDDTAAQLKVVLPQSLAHLTDDELYQAQPKDQPQTLSSGMFGLGFTLRLAAAEARAAGGSLHREEGRLVLTLPQPSAVSAKISEA